MCKLLFVKHFKIYSGFFLLSLLSYWLYSLPIIDVCEAFCALVVLFPSIFGVIVVQDENLFF